METAEGPFPGMQAIHVSDVTSKHGFGILSERRLDAVSGDRLRVSLYARGKGRMSVEYTSHTAERAFIKAGAAGKSFDLTDDWELYECDLPVSDKMNKGKVTGQAQPSLHGAQGSECWFADVRAEVLKGARDARMLPEVRELRDSRDCFREDFEKGVKGGEELTTDIAPGLLHKTKVGVYRTGSKTALPAAARGVPLPKVADSALSLSCRLYSLKGVFTTSLSAGGRALTLAMRALKPVRTIELTLAEGGSEVAVFRVPRRILPADFRLDLNGVGGWAVEVASLADSSVRRYGGVLPAPLSGSASVGWEIAAEPGQNGGVAVDNLAAFVSSVREKSGEVPFKIEHLAEFDPVKAGWPLVFSDEFEGTSLDTNKWYFPHYAGQHKDCVYLDGNGHLVVEAKMGTDPKTGKERLVTDGIWSSLGQTYGYFESRLKFTKMPGWWAAFWLYGTMNANPFIDGFEIDIFEDYYTRSAESPGTNKAILDHNTHVRMNGVTKSRNFTTKIPGDTDGWHVIACRWTPFEISYYMDGKLMPSTAGHGGFDSVTFDAFRHFAGLSPLHAIISGQPKGWKDPKFKPEYFPEKFEVDWVRPYAYPQPKDEFPSIAWRKGPDDMAMVKEGTMLGFSFDVAKAEKTGSAISAVYLFDNGYMIDYKTEPPYSFDVRFSKQAYDYTRYMRPGRSGDRPVFAPGPHVFVAFVQDAAGKVSHTEPVWRIPAAPKAVPYEGVASKLPGTISPVRFDEGGRGVSQFTQDGRNKHWAPTRTNDTVTAAKAGYVGTLYGGDWLNYTVDVEEAGEYELRAAVGTGVRQYAALRFFLDGMPLGRLAIDSFTRWKVGVRDDCGVTTVRLPAGRHVLTMAIEGGLTIHAITFNRKGTTGK